MQLDWSGLLTEFGFCGDFDVSLGARQRYATDASVYEQLPQVVLWPRHTQDIQVIVRLAQHLSVPITMRGAGTSLAGQAIGEGIIVDTTRYLCSVLDIDLANQTVKVQPGVVLDDLNAQLSVFGLWLALDTSTANRCVIGGIVGNNSCGAYSVAFGTPRDQIVDIEAVLSDASLVSFSSLSPVEFDEKLALNNLEGEIYRCIERIGKEEQQQLFDSFPDASIIRRNTGYALDVLAMQPRWQQVADGRANLAPLICGSEGTLALVTAVRFRLHPLPKHRALVVVQFDELFAALDATTSLLTLNPVAVELIDAPTLAGTKDHAGFNRYRFWLSGEPSAVQVVELFAHDEQALQQKISQALNIVNTLAHAYDARVLQGAEMAAVWQIRKAGLGLLMGKVGKRKAVAVIEDAAVPVSSLSSFMRDIRGLMSELSVNCIYYGHASVGLIHLRPELVLTDADDQVKFVTIAQRVSTLVKFYKGALSGEHGDGRLRGAFLREQLGEQAYALCVQTKQAFDPVCLLNPQRIISSLPIDEDWRKSVSDVVLLTGFDWSSDAGFGSSVEKCNGAGACRQSLGAMCPSFQVTRDDALSTRGRANLLRFALQSENPVVALSQSDLTQALSSCLSCKACKAECPASVDMSRLKSEVLFQQHQAGSVAWSVRAMGYYHLVLPWLNRARGMFRVLNQLSLSKRQVPIADGRDAKNWWHKEGLKHNPKTSLFVVVLIDIYSRWLHPKQVKATLRVLQTMGYRVEPIWLESSARLFISHGFLNEARQALNEVLRDYQDLLEGSEAIVGIDPAELLVWRDDGLALVEQADLFALTQWQSKLFVFEEAMLKLTPLVNDWCWPLFPYPVAIQVHCHQRSLVGVTTSQQAFALLGVTVESLSDGCCGMAGSFGYQQMELSEAIAQKQLLPNIERLAEKSVLVTAGSSCRQQIRDFSAKDSQHPAEVFALALKIDGFK